MAEGAHFDGHFIEQVSDGLETLEIGVFCNTFSERGKRQNEEVRRFKDRRIKRSIAFSVKISFSVRSVD